ncbi:unnamed protein product [Meloidogyne enterolobii]|uniref:Uncharacterized protein n=1 Tax=Meloidogyne enterolobii TaxID=390850 RepID=A0ACB0YHR1_MELEN
MDVFVLDRMDVLLFSNCLDSGTNDLFLSHGRKKRHSNTIASSSNDANSEETLSAIIRVLADGEMEEEVERFYNQTLEGKIIISNKSRINDYLPEKEVIDHNLVCMADSVFLSIVASMSMICLLLSALIVIWGCYWLQTENKENENRKS